MVAEFDLMLDDGHARHGYDAGDGHIPVLITAEAALDGLRAHAT